MVLAAISDLKRFDEKWYQKRRQTAPPLFLEPSTPTLLHNHAPLQNQTRICALPQNATLRNATCSRTLQQNATHSLRCVVRLQCSTCFVL